MVSASLTDLEYTNNGDCKIDPERRELRYENKGENFLHLHQKYDKNFVSFPEKIVDKRSRAC